MQSQTPCSPSYNIRPHDSAENILETTMNTKIAHTLQHYAVCGLGLLLATVPLLAVESQWIGAGGSSWSSSGNWTAGTPGASDTAVFNADGVSAVQNIFLDQNASVSGVAVNANASGGVGIASDAEIRSLTIGTRGLRLEDGAGSLAFGDGLNLLLNGIQTWTNGSASAVSVAGTIGNTKASTLTVRGPGAFVFDGEIKDGSAATTLVIENNADVTLTASNSYTGTLTARAATVRIEHDRAFSTSQLTLDGAAHICIEDFPKQLANKVRVQGTASNARFLGDAPLTLSGAPAFTVASYANAQMIFAMTSPLEISGVFSLNDGGSGYNNGKRGFCLGSGANVTISGDIQDNNAGNTLDSKEGAGFTFIGGGANLTIAGNNNFGLLGSTSLGSGANAYNTITVGGTNDIITPFGVNKVDAGHTRTVFIKAERPGLTLANGFQHNGSGHGTAFGFDGEHALTIAGLYENACASTYTASFLNIAQAPLTFSGRFQTRGNKLAILGSGDTIFAPSSVITNTTANSTVSFIKQGSGSLTLAGYTTHTNTFSLEGGTVVLDYSAANTNKLAAGTTANALVLGGVDLQLKGGDYRQTLGEGGGTTLNAGASSIRRVSGSSTINLGAITRDSSNGATLDVQPGIVHTSSANAAGILHGYGYVTVDGRDFAINDNDTIAALVNYGDYATANANINALVSGSVNSAGKTVGTLKIISTSDDDTLINSSYLTIDRSGILFTGDHNYEITGGFLRGRNSYFADLIIHHYGAKTLTISSQIVSHNNNRLTKAGPGTLRLTNPANSYSQGTYVTGGTLCISTNSNLGAISSPLTLNGGTLQTTAGIVMLRKVSLGYNGGTIQVDTDTLEITDVISGSYGTFAKTGAGTLKLSTANTYSMPTFIREGTLEIGHENALGSIVTSNRSGASVYVQDGATLDVAGFPIAIGNFTLENGLVTDSEEEGSLASYSFVVKNGTIDAVLTDSAVNLGTTPHNSVNLYKRAEGSVFLNSANTYTGNTFVEEGTLYVNGSIAGAAHVYRNGTLAGSGSIARTVLVDAGTLFPVASNTTPATLSLGRSVMLYNGAVFKVLATPAGCSEIVLTNPDARVRLYNAELALVFTSGVPVEAEFTLINNTGTHAVEGRFNNLPEGAKLTVGGRRFVITYCGGDGNDVVLNGIRTSTLFLVR